MPGISLPDSETKKRREIAQALIMATLAHLQGFPPIDTQMHAWLQAADEIYDAIKDDILWD